MDKIHDILIEINDHLIQCAKDNSRCSYSEEDVNNICDDCELLLTLWDSALSEV